MLLCFSFLSLINQFSSLHPATPFISFCCSFIFILREIHSTSPKPRKGLRDMNHSESETFNDGLAILAVRWTGTLRALTTSNLFPNTQVPSHRSSLAEEEGIGYTISPGIACVSLFPHRVSFFLPLQVTYAFFS